MRAPVVALSVPLLLGLLMPVASPPEAPAAPPGVVVFAAGGDHSWGSAFDASLAALASSGTDFYLALGDLSYDVVGTEALWCADVQAAVGAAYPFELVSGNHEDDAMPNGWIGDFVTCLPDHLNATGVYGAEYYLDYPPSAPLVRAIMIGADLTVFGTTYDYFSGNARYTWLTAAIDGARAMGIPWVVVGMHKNCITTGEKTCSIGTDLFNLLMEKRVDLVLQGHDHNVQRSKQLACAAITVDGFDPACVADDGADNFYAKGAGIVVNIGGSFGQCCYPINLGDPELPYFASTNSDTNGFWKYTVTIDTLTATFVPTAGGSFTDDYVISGSSPQPPAPPTGLDAAIVGSDVALGWVLSNPETDVDHYEVWKGAAYSPGRGGYVRASPNLPPGTLSWIDRGGVSPGGLRLPDGDVSAGVWGPLPLWSALDDGSDVDFITATNAGTGDVALADLGDPATSAGHVLRYRARASGAGGAAERMRAELFQGGTLVAGAGSIVVSRGVFSTWSYTLTIAEADAITDYTDLRVRLVVETLGGGEAVDVSWVEFETPMGPRDAFYAVIAVSAVAAAPSPGQAAKFVRSVPAGPALLSLPVLTPLPSLPLQFQGTMTWTEARHFDAGDAADPWAARYPARAGDLSSVGPEDGLWLTVTTAGEYQVAGRVPCQTAIALHAGWNLVGFPGMAPFPVNDATAGLVGPLQVEAYDASAAPYYLQRLGPGSLLEPTRGYWVRSVQDQTWTVVNDPAASCQ